MRDYFVDAQHTEIESVFLMSRSNCAFVNYRTEAACIEAADRFRNANFDGALLACRVRKHLPGFDSAIKPVRSSPPLETPRSPVIVSSTPLDGRTRLETPQPVQVGRDEKLAGTTPSPGQSGRSHGKNRYFILKSLTNRDLDVSVQSGFWATQSHNEAMLNDAFTVRFSS